MANQRNIAIGGRRGASLLHVEAPGCIINIRVNLADGEGRSVTAISIEADGDRYAGGPQWWINGERGNKGAAVRVIRANNLTA